MLAARHSTRYKGAPPRWPANRSSVAISQHPAVTPASSQVGSQMENACPRSAHTAHRRRRALLTHDTRQTSESRPKAARQKPAGRARRGEKHHALFPVPTHSSARRKGELPPSRSGFHFCVMSRWYCHNRAVVVVIGGELRVVVRAHYCFAIYSFIRPSWLPPPPPPELPVFSFSFLSSP